MLMSMTRAPAASATRAASAIQCGSQPASWTTCGSIPVAFGPQPRLGGAADELVRRDHLGDDEPGPEAPGDAAERHVGDAGQRREDGPAVDPHGPMRDLPHA